MSNCGFVSYGFKSHCPTPLKVLILFYFFEFLTFFFLYISKLHNLVFIFLKNFDIKSAVNIGKICPKNLTYFFQYVYNRKKKIFLL